MGTGNLSIRLQGGSSDRAQVELKAGTPVEAFSVGADGGWRVSAAGLAPVHAYLYFDGTHLFVACAPGAIVQLGAATVGTDWKPVAAPAVIKLGQVSLSVEESGAQPKPAAPAGAGPVARPQPSAAPVARPRPSAAPAARPQAARPQPSAAPVARPQPSAAPVARPQPSAAPNRQGPPVTGAPRAAPAPAARPARPGPPPLGPRATGPTPRPQPTAPRAGPKPVRPPGEVMAAAPKAAPQPGASDYDDSESPTQYQPMPDGFSEKTLPPQESPVGSPSEPPTRIHAPGSTGLDEEVLSEEATRVIPAPSETPAVAPAQPTGGVPKRTMLGMAPPPPTSAELARGAAEYAAPVPAPEPQKPERPKPPSQPPPGENATVVKPLEQFLAEAGGRSLPGDSPDTAKQPLMAPAAAQPPGAGAPPWGSDPYAQTQPPFGQQQPAPAATVGAYPGAPGYAAADANAFAAQQAAYAQQPGAYGAQPGAYGAQPGAYGAQQPGAYGAPQPGAYGAPGAYGEQQAGAFGAQPAGAYGMPAGAGASGQYPQQQFPGASGTFGQAGAGYPQQQAWGQQPVQGQPGKGPLAAWKAMPFPRKLMFLMLPFGLIAFVIVFTDPPQPPPRAKGSASASAKGAPSSAPSAQPVDTAALAPTGAPPPTGESSAQPPEPSAAKPEPSAARPEPSAARPEPSVAPPEAPPQPIASAEPPLPKGEVSLARKAADAVANNEFAKAADLYDQLAKQHPENPTYARAAEILRKKAKK